MIKWLLSFLFLITIQAHAQYSNLNMHQVTVKNGLHDQAINGLCQDAEGFIWMSTMGALNRYDGIKTKRITNIPGDSTSPLEGVPQGMCSDHNGNLWFAFTNGMMKYNFEKGNFQRIPFFSNHHVMQIIDAGKELVVVTTEELLLFNPQTFVVRDFIDDKDSVSKKIYEPLYTHDFTFSDGKLYISTDGGVAVYHLKNRALKYYPIEGMNKAVSRIYATSGGEIYLSNFDDKKLWRLDQQNYIYTDVSYLLRDHNGRTPGAATDFMEDKNHNLWIICGDDAIVKITPQHQTFFYEYHNQVPVTLLPSVFKAMLCDREGTIWMRSLTGADFFHPDRNIFSCIKPVPGNRYAYSRNSCEDNAQLWLTSTAGISSYNPDNGKYEVWSSVLDDAKRAPFPSSRGVVRDSEGTIWTTTIAGLFRYNSSTGMFDQKEIPSELSGYFYYSIYADDGTIWLGSREHDGIYYRTPDRVFHSVREHPVLKKFTGFEARCFYRDHKGLLWIGTDDKGLIIYNPSDKDAKRISYSGSGKDDLLSNTIIDIKEDRQGIIWVSSLGGINGMDENGNIKFGFSIRNGLRSNKCGPVAVDKADRIWVGTSNGLVVIEPSRKSLIIFDESDGLTSSSFSESQGCVLNSGEMIFPATDGFIKFNPIDYIKEDPIVPFFASGYSVLNKNYSLQINDASPEIILQPDQNFITIEFTALNYLFPQHTRYAYKLEGIDKDWHYSEFPQAVYTSLPGGKYVLRYKATANASEWNIKEKKLYIIVETALYNKWWFRFLAAFSVVMIVFLFVRYRIRQKQEIVELNNRAQLLEREKSVVMYENLKQQLNPHFLFNSLTSLSSLITTDQKVARQFVDQMSKIYRYILKSSDNEIVPLINELNFAKSYIGLQQTRFGNGLHININIDEEWNTSKIVPVTVQNMIENAIKHNIIDDESPLVIDIFVEDSYLVVTNNLQKKSVVESSNKTGLKQMIALYKFLIDKPIIIEETESRFTIRIPLI